MHFRSRQSDFLVLMFFAKCFPHLTHRGTVCAVPRFFLFGTLCHKVKAQRVSVGPQTEGAARHNFGTTCPEVAGFGEALQQAFLQPAGMQK